MAGEENWKDIPQGVSTMIDRVREILTVDKVVGEPIERDGVTLVPVAAIRGGGGGGGGEGQTESAEEGSGGGLGFGVTARPVGAYVMHDGQVDWKPAVDPARMAAVIILMAFLVTRTLRAWLIRS